MLGYFETVQSFATTQFTIPAWEVIFYVSVMTVYAFLGRPISCLINTFAFTFYWGFVSLLPTVFAASDVGHVFLFVYLFSGIVIYAAATISNLRAPREKESSWSRSLKEALAWSWRPSAQKTRS